jgi:hypothetical protein
MLLKVKWPVQYQDYKDEAEELAVLVADNKIAELSGIDGQVMADVIVQLDQVDYPVELTGMPKDQIEYYIDGPLGDIDGFFDPTDPTGKQKKLICPHCGKNVHEKPDEGDQS